MASVFTELTDEILQGKKVKLPPDHGINLNSLRVNIWRERKVLINKQKELGMPVDNKPLFMDRQDDGSVIIQIREPERMQISYYILDDYSGESDEDV